MPHIRVLEVATFYTMFNLEPVGKYFIQFCGTTPCELRGAGEMKKVLERRVGEERQVSAGRRLLLAGGRVPGRVLQCPDGADQRRTTTRI